MTPVRETESGTAPAIRAVTITHLSLRVTKTKCNAIGRSMVSAALNSMGQSAVPETRLNPARRVIAS